VARAVIAIVAVALVAGCGEEERPPTARTTAEPPANAAQKTDPAPYEPSAEHARRPPGAVYDDEIGEDVVGTPYSRIIEVFGPPLAQRGPCVYYRIVGRRRAWRFCFEDGVMESASGNQRLPR
jgi:hypothetical protein